VSWNKLPKWIGRFWAVGAAEKKTFLTIHGKKKSW
jgi:hypothetical protein